MTLITIDDQFLGFSLMTLSDLHNNGEKKTAMAKHEVGICYAQAERSTRLEWAGYNQVT